MAKSVASASIDPTMSTEAPALTTQGMIVGTPFYMSPEQMRGEALDGRADQFAWGVLAYELLTGRAPWSSDGDALHVVSQILSAEPPAPRSIRPEIPEGVDAVVTRALAKSREGRFASMGDLVDAIVNDAVVRQSIPDPFAPTQATAAVTEKRLTPTPDLRERAPPVRRTGARVATALVAAVAVLGGGAWVRQRAVSPPAGPAPSADAGPALGPARFPDFGSALSKNEEATIAYRGAMHAARDADTAGAQSELDRAVGLDPSFAAARLRRALVSLPLSPNDRDDLREATRFRASLGAHDRAILDAVAPLLEIPARRAATEERFARALDAAPDDADIALLLCRMRNANERYEEARAACERAKALDPESAAALREMAVVKMNLGDEAGARGDYEECLRVSPLATSCLQPLWDLEAIAGRCDEALATARRLVAISPTSATADDCLANSLLAAGEPIESVRLALAEKAAHTPPSMAELTKRKDAAYLAVATGDFATARAELRAWDDAIASSRNEADHYPATGTRIQLAAEEGRRDEAVALASSYLKRRPAWTLVPEQDYSFYFVGQLYALGALPRPDFVAKRSRWTAASAGDSVAWVTAYAIPATTPEDGREALAALGADASILEPTLRWPEFEAPVGKTYRLAGRSEEAVVHLRLASRACQLLSNPFEQMAGELPARGRARGPRAHEGSVRVVRRGHRSLGPHRDFGHGPERARADGRAPVCALISCRSWAGRCA